MSDYPFGSRGDPSLQRHIGSVWGKFSANTRFGADPVPAFASEDLEAYLGCMLTNYEVTPELETEEIPLSCTTGKFTFQKGKSYKVKVETRNLSTMIRAAMMGTKVVKGTAVSPLATEMVMRERTLDVTLVGSATTIALAAAGYLGAGLAAADLIKIVGLYRKDTKDWWSEAAAASTALRNYSLSGTTLTFVSLGASDVVFSMTVQYMVAMTTDDLKLIEDGVTFPNTFDLNLSWLRTVEQGPDKGKKTMLICALKNIALTSIPVLGGTAQDVHTDAFEGTVNFQQEGDIMFYEIALSA
jgi:hypothetical protein